MNSHKQNLIYLAGRYDDLFGEQTLHFHNNFDKIFILTFHRAFKNEPSIYSPTKLPENVKVVEIGKYVPPVRLSYFSGYFGKVFYSQLLKLYAFKAVRFLKRNRINASIVHAHFVLPGGLIASYLKDMLGSKVILTAHGYDVYDLPFKNDYVKKLCQTVFKKCDKIITVSDSNACILKTLDIQNVAIVPNGFDSKLFFPMDATECKNILKLPQSGKVLLNVGSLTKVKGHKYLLEAFKKVVLELNDIYLVILGDGELKDELVRYSETIGISENVIFTGWVPHENIKIWMNACDIFVLSSIAEGNPLVMFETLGCGKPFIGTNVGGVSEIITDDRLGFVVEPKNPDALSDAIIKAVNHKWDENYISNYSKQYTWENIAKNTMAIYDELLVHERY